MPNDYRNAKVVIGLMVAMTAGAALLRWLEPHSSDWSGGGTVLMAESALPVRSVRVEYAPPQRAVDASAFDAVIAADGQMQWRPHSEDIRILLLGGGGERLPEPQSRRLLATLGRIRHERSEVVSVTLDERSDVRQNPDLPAQAADLRALLVRKAFID